MYEMKSSKIIFVLYTHILSVVIVWATKDFISEEINEKYNKEYDRLYFSKRSSEYNELHS